MNIKFSNYLLIPTLFLVVISSIQAATAFEWMQILPKGITGAFQQVIKVNDGRWMISGRDRSYVTSDFHHYEPLDPTLSNVVQHEGVFVGLGFLTGGIFTSMLVGMI